LGKGRRRLAAPFCRKTALALDRTCGCVRDLRLLTCRTSGSARLGGEGGSFEN
jgi:hypothetical protein